MPEPTRLEPKPWMTAPATRKVMAALAAGGGEARFVGGCVRDSVLGRPVRDIDIATHEPPERVMALLADAGIKAVPTGIEHGTVTVVVGKEHFEVTTLRLDVATDGRRAEVAFTDDWAEDAARRDFTINALALAEDGTLFDPFGGLADLRAGRVRFVGEARARIREDVLRLLRFFRFHAWYGRPPPDAEALAAVGELAHLIPTLSGERVWAELRRILLAPEPAPVLGLMEAQGVLAEIFPGPRDIACLGALATVEAIEGAGAGEGDALRRLAALTRPDTAVAAALAELLRLSRAERRRLEAMAAPEAEVAADMGPREARRAVSRRGAEAYRDLLMLAWAGERAEGGGPARDAEFSALLEVGTVWRPPELPVRGEDAVRLGVAPGPTVGEALEKVEAWWIAEDFRPGREACLEKLKAVVSGNPTGKS